MDVAANKICFGVNAMMYCLKNKQQLFSNLNGCIVTYGWAPFAPLSARCQDAQMKEPWNMSFYTAARTMVMDSNL